MVVYRFIFIIFYFFRVRVLLLEIFLNFFRVLFLLLQFFPCFVFPSIMDVKRKMCSNPFLHKRVQPVDSTRVLFADDLQFHPMRRRDFHWKVAVWPLVV